MRKLLLSVTIALCGFSVNAQLRTTASGGSVKAMVSERVGITDVTINYGRPAVKGREGKIWGGLVYTGYQQLGYGAGNDAPWRAGANENTTIEFSTNVMVEGHAVAAGKYGLFIAYDPGMCTVILSSNTTSWGSYFYDKKEDVLRFTVKPVTMQESKERLTYEFSNETDSSATITLSWEKLAIPFKVATQLVQLQLASYENELRGDKGFDEHALAQVADYMNEHDTHLQEALVYINRAAESMPSFSVLMTKAQLLEKLHMQAQADSSVQMAMNTGTTLELHAYGRKLLAEKKPQKALEVFQLNYKRHPNTFTTAMGMARGYAANGKPKDALKYANMALPLAPDAANKQSAETLIATLKEAK